MSVTSVLSAKTIAQVPYDQNVNKYSDDAYKILCEVFNRRNIIGQTEVQRFDLHTIKSLPTDELSPHIDRIQAMMDLQQPIQMVLPAFPGKSPNRGKTFGYRPDLADQLALEALATLCQDIAHIYAPGAVMSICSDGYVFSDLVKIPDEHVKEYTDAIEHWTTQRYPQYFQYFDLLDAYPDLNCLATCREELMINFAESIRLLKESARTDPHTMAMYRGITRFIFEDYKGLDEFKGQSNTRIQKNARHTAYRVIQRSNAWGVLLAERFPQALRLSIHPQFSHSGKIGIRLVSGLDLWRTPWHSVAVVQGKRIFLEKRSEVDESIYRLVFKHGHPSHYECPPGSDLIHR